MASQYQQQKVGAKAAAMDGADTDGFVDEGLTTEEAKPKVTTTPAHEGPSSTLPGYAAHNDPLPFAEGFDAYDGPDARVFEREGDFSRTLTPEDLGSKGLIEELKGNFSVTDKQAKVRIDYVKAQRNNLKEIIDNLSGLAKSHGAETLTIEGTFANDKFYRVLPRWYEVKTEGANDSIVIKLS